MIVKFKKLISTRCGVPPLYKAFHQCDGVSACTAGVLPLGDCDMQKTFLGIPADKVAHFLMFLPFPILAFFAYDRLTRTPWQALAALISICAIGCAFAGMTEVVQDFLPYRVKDFNDFGADCLAVGIASVLVFIIDVSKMKKE